MSADENYHNFRDYRCMSICRIYPKFSGSLMAKSCQATLVLAGHSEEMQSKGFEFGKQIALAWQVGCTA